MTELDVYLSKIMPFAPGCPEITAFEHIVSAAQDFCERTKLWREHDEFSVTPSGCEAICVPVGAVLIEIERARVDSYLLEPIALHDLEARHPNWHDFTPGAGHWITQTSLDTMRIVPGTTGRFSMDLILKPADNVDQLPDFLATHYRGIIAEGALARILMLPSQKFADPSRAQYYQAKFDKSVDGLMHKSTKGQQNAPLRVKAHFM
jgi:hypothetical protein